MCIRDRRTEALAVEEDLSLTRGSDEPGVALPGGGAGVQHEQPTEPLSVLIETLNERFGMSLTEADRVWFEQQKQAIKASADLSLIHI